MEAKGLRIGNLIRYRDERDCIVSCLGSMFETENTYNGLVSGSGDVEEYIPIEITKEWIDRQGEIRAKHTNNYDGCVDDTYYKWSYNIKHGYIYEGDCDCLATIVNWSPIRYVHEYQNFYYEQTKEELEVK